MSRTGLELFRRPVDAVFRPSTIVRTPPTYEAGSLRRKLLLAAKLLVFFVANLLLYTLPLSFAGIGTVSAATAVPPAFEALVGWLVAPETAWLFVLRSVQNSLFLLTAAVITFAAFHVGVAVTGSSRGVIRSLRVVTYSSALYLATIFTLVWLASTSPQVEVADDLLLALQSEFIYYFIDLLGSNLQLPGGRPSVPPTSGLTDHGLAVLSGLAVSVGYYAYILYLGARKTHGTSRLESAFVVGFVAASPALYVVGSILVVEFAVAVPDLLFA